MGREEIPLEEYLNSLDEELYEISRAHNKVIEEEDSFIRQTKYLSIISSCAFYSCKLSLIDVKQNEKIINLLEEILSKTKD